MPALANAARFEKLLSEKGKVEISGPTRRKTSDRRILVDKLCYGLLPYHKIRGKNYVKPVPKQSITDHHYNIFMDGEFLGHYRERHDEEVLVLQLYEGGMPGYDFASDGGHGRQRKNVYLVFLPLSSKRFDDYPSIEFP